MLRNSEDKWTHIPGTLEVQGASFDALNSVLSVELKQRGHLGPDTDSVAILRFMDTDYDWVDVVGEMPTAAKMPSKAKVRVVCVPASSAPGPAEVAAPMELDLDGSNSEDCDEIFGSDFGDDTGDERAPEDDALGGGASVTAVLATAAPESATAESAPNSLGGSLPGGAPEAGALANVPAETSKSVPYNLRDRSSPSGNPAQSGYDDDGAVEPLRCGKRNRSRSERDCRQDGVRPRLSATPTGKAEPGKAEEEESDATHSGDDGIESEEEESEGEDSEFSGGDSSGDDGSDLSEHEDGSDDDEVMADESTAKDMAGAAGLKVKANRTSIEVSWERLARQLDVPVSSWKLVLRQKDQKGEWAAIATKEKRAQTKPTYKLSKSEGVSSDAEFEVEIIPIAEDDAPLDSYKKTTRTKPDTKKGTTPMLDRTPRIELSRDERKALVEDKGGAGKLVLDRTSSICTSVRADAER